MYTIFIIIDVVTNTFHFFGGKNASVGNFTGNSRRQSVIDQRGKKGKRDK